MEGDLSNSIIKNDGFVENQDHIKFFGDTLGFLNLTRLSILGSFNKISKTQFVIAGLPNNHKTVQQIV